MKCKEKLAVFPKSGKPLLCEECAAKEEWHPGLVLNPFFMP